MNQCNHINNFINSKNIDELVNIYNCKCIYCDCKYCYNKFYNEIKNINVNENIEYNNNLNLIWTKSMKFIRKYLYIFENNIY